MKIYTKRGDEGETDLFGGMRVTKNHIRVKAYGQIDAANSALGLSYAASQDVPYVKEKINILMKLMFSLGAEIACAPKESSILILQKHLKNPISENHIEKMENWIDEMEKRLNPLKHFILPAGSELSSRLHFARNMVRLAEIAIIDLKQSKEVVRPEIIIFLNRLSDLLFVFARFSNHELEVKDEEWSGKDTI